MNNKASVVIATLLVALIGFSLSNIEKSQNLSLDPPKTVPYV